MEKKITRTIAVYRYPYSEITMDEQGGLIFLPFDAIESPTKLTSKQLQKIANEYHPMTQIYWGDPEVRICTYSMPLKEFMEKASVTYSSPQTANAAKENEMSKEDN